MTEQEKLDVCDSVLTFIVYALAEIERAPETTDRWLDRIDYAARKALQVIAEGNDNG